MRIQIFLILVIIFSLLTTFALTFPSIETTANPWQKIESPVYPVLNNLYFLSMNDGWIVGDLGIVLHTTDGGENWNSISVGTNTTLRTVFFSDSTTGYIGGKGILLKIIDGGNTWDITTGEFSIQDIYFKSQNRNFGYAVSLDGQILSTSDYGDNWKIQTTLTQSMNEITFNSPERGWITASIFSTGSGSWSERNGIGGYSFSASTTFPLYKGALIKTDNSGLSWSMNSSYILYSDIQFINPAEGWLLISRITSYQIHQITDLAYSLPHESITYGHYEFTYNILHQIYRTTNGGDNWETHSVFSEISTSHFKPLSMSFLDESHGYILDTKSQDIYVTNNGGINWSRQTTGILNTQACKIHFLSTNQGIIIGPDISENLKMGLILLTQDGGNRWTKKSPLGFSPKASLTAISFDSYGNGWLAGSGSNPVQYHSNDNGLTWEPISVNPSWGEQIYIFGDNTVYFVGGNTYFTSNNGINWDALPIELEAMGVQYSDPSTIHIYGYHNFFFGVNGAYYYYNPTINKSTDYGNTWNSTYSLSWAHYYISKIYFQNQTTGWALLHYYSSGHDETQRILHTTDGGSTWEDQYLSETTGFLAFNDIIFNTSSTGWICDDYGRLFYTSDGGNNWNYWGQPVESSLNKIYFQNDRVGWILGDYGILLQTTNGGESWEYLEPITDSNLYDISFTNDGKGYIVGQKGTMLYLRQNSVGPTNISKGEWDLFE